MKTSFSVGTPTGLQPLVARRRLILFCLTPPRLGATVAAAAGGVGCFWDSRVRTAGVDNAEPSDGVVALCGHSLDSLSRGAGGGGCSRPPVESGVRRWGLAWVEEGDTLGRGQLEMGRAGLTSSEGLCSPLEDE